MFKSHTQKEKRRVNQRRQLDPSKKLEVQSATAALSSFEVCKPAERHQWACLYLDWRKRQLRLAALVGGRKQQVSLFSRRAAFQALEGGANQPRPFPRLAGSAEGQPLLRLLPTCRSPRGRGAELWQVGILERVPGFPGSICAPLPGSGRFVVCVFGPTPVEVKIASFAALRPRTEGTCWMEAALVSVPTPASARAASHAPNLPFLLVERQLPLDTKGLTSE